MATPPGLTPPDPPLLLGIDIGTSAAKAVLIDRGGRVVATAAAGYPISHPKPGWSEQDPEVWWRATVGVIRAVLADAAGSGLTPDRTLAGIGFSGQMHGSVLLDGAALASRGERGAALRPALLWNDQRTARECAEIESALGGRRGLVEVSGNAALTGFTLPKLLWVRRHEPGVFERAAAVLTPKDFVRFRLTGEAAIDVGDAAGTLLLDIDQRRWSERTARAVGIEPSLLPPVLESGAVAGRITPWAAAQTGLAEGTPVVAGSGDNMAGAVGAGVVSAGDVLATIGTSGVIYAHAERARKDLHSSESTGRVHTMCAADGSAGVRGHWCITGCTLSAGGALRWARDVLAPGVAYGALLAEAEAAPPGCEGLVFLPYLTGERCPHPDPRARGGWIGLSARHTRAHLIRAVVEGVTYTMAQILEIDRAIGVEVRSVRLGGGGARSALWRQMQADVYGAPVAMTNTEEGPAYGAALLAGVGAGVWPDVRAACAATIRVTEEREPDRAMGERYAPTMAVHAGLYTSLAPAFASLSDAAGG